MLEIRKGYSSLSEVSQAWSLRRAHVRYLAEKGHLRLSVPLFGFVKEYSMPVHSVFAEEDDAPTLVGGRRVDGPVDLQRSDIAAVFRDGETKLYQIDTEDGCALLLGDAAITVRLQDLVVRQEERLRFEAEEMPRILEPANPPCFSEIEIDGKHLRFPPTAARALGELYNRALKDERWHYGQELCDTVGVGGIKLGAPFKRHPEWRLLVESDGTGQYRFIPARARELSGRSRLAG